LLNALLVFKLELGGLRDLVMLTRISAARSAQCPGTVAEIAAAAIDCGQLNPTLRIEGQSVVLHPLEIVSVAIENLGELVDSLKEDGDKVIAALDELLTRWR